MKRALLMACVPALLLGTASHADELQPMAAQSIHLGHVSGVAYYTEGKDGYEVVATVASGETATPVRFVTTLLSGQKTTISVPREAGFDPLAIEISRQGDRVFVIEGVRLSSLTVN